MKVQLILSFCLWYCIGQAIADVAAARAGPKKVVCYWGTWAYYRPGGGQFALSNVDPRLCTHVIYTFAGLADCAIKKLDPNLDDDKGFLRDLPTLKRANSGLKVSIAIGGWNEGSEKYSTMASDAKCRGRFIQSVKAFLNQYKLDGFDVDWEYPGQRGGRPADKANYINLLCGLREAFQGKYLLSAAVGAPQSAIDISYDVRGMNRCLDFINLMAYDFHGSWDGKTGHNAPLKSSDAFNDDASVSAWLKSGASADKLILGIPLYGHTYTLKNAQQNGLGAATSGPGPAGQYTREAGMVGYNEICEFYKGFQMRWDDGAQVPYSYSGSTWISYDDPRSVQAKAKYAAGRNLGGAMVWSIETDDFNNRCGGGKYPLLNAIRKGLSLRTFAEDEVVLEAVQAVEPDLFKKDSVQSHL